MRHRISQKKFSRSSSHRKAMIRNLVISLVSHGRIVTTLPKAKSLKPIVERLVTKAKNASGLSARRLLLSKLGNNEKVVSKMLDEFPVRYGNRPGGYTRIYKCGYRKGDCAPVAIIELLDHDIDIAVS